MARIAGGAYDGRMSFKISGLDIAQFRVLFGLSDEQLATKNVVRVVADEKPAFPCRVQMRDAELGEKLLLLNYEHQSASSPYRSAHAIFVIEDADAERFDEVDCVPEVLRRRQLSVRSFDAGGMMLDAEVIDGAELEALIERFFREPRAAYLHVHNAKRGCYAARVDRVR
jgi:hypothetical protein